MEFDLFCHGLGNLHVPKYVRGSFATLCLAVGDVCGPAPTSAPVEIFCPLDGVGFLIFSMPWVKRKRRLYFIP
jgi:hypothetical protein